jgi:hypothetical protein
MISFLTIQEDTILLDIAFRIMISFLTVSILSKYEGCCLKILAQPFLIRYFDKKGKSRTTAFGFHIIVSFSTLYTLKQK